MYANPSAKGLCLLQSWKKQQDIILSYNETESWRKSKKQGVARLS
jgi:hypothetical protein